MQSKDKIQLIFTGILVLCAMVITGLVLRQQFFPPVSRSNVRIVENWKELELTGYRSGSESAPVQIIEFFDFQCPFCKRVQPTVAAVIEKYGKKVTVVYEHFPLSGHQYAMEAAVAAECAHKQGKFNVFHRLLFSNQEQLRTLSYVSVASLAGVPNLNAFSTCMEGQESAARVLEALNLGKRLGISGIPTFLINGALVSGALSEQQLTALVEQALSKIKE